MHHQLKLLAIAILFPVLSYGQAVDGVYVGESGPPIPAGKFMTLIDHVATIDGHHYVLLGGTDGRDHFQRVFLRQNLFERKAMLVHHNPRVWKIDPSGKLVASRFGPELQAEFDVLGMVELQDQLFLIRSQRSKNREQIAVFMQPISPAGLDLDMMPTSVAAIVLKSKTNPGFVAAEKSDNEAYLGFLTADIKLKKLNHAPVKMTVVNPKMDLKWRREVDLTEKGKLKELVDFGVDNRGKFYLLIKEVALQQGGEVSFRLLQYGKEIEGRSMFTADPALKGQILRMQMDFDPEGNLICSGFYSPKGQKDKQMAFVRVYDTISGELLQTGDHEFDTAFLNGDQTAKEAKGSADDLLRYPSRTNNFRPKGLFPKAGGGYYLVGEEWKNVASSSSQRGMGASSYNYYYHSIAVLGLNPEGQFEWAVKIPKRVRSDKEGGNTGSFFTWATPEKLRFFYTDDHRNATIAPGDPIRAYDTGERSNGAVHMATVSSDGKVKRAIAVSGNGASVQCIPSLSAAGSGEGGLLGTLRGSSFKLRPIMVEE